MVCRTRREDHALWRAGRSRDGSWHLGRGVGRGLWLCGEGACASELGVHHVARALRGKVTPGEFEALRDLATSKRSQL